MRKLFVRIMLITAPEPTFWEKISYVWCVILRLWPVVFMMDLIDWWFSENEQFGTFMCLALLANMGVGAWFHIKNRTFSVKDFLFKNIEMIAVVVVGYIMLEMLRYTAGDNVAGEIFRVFIQVTTLLYPASKVLKNIFIISNGKYPPEFVMHRLYNFEKNGDLNEFFKIKKEDDHEG